MYYEMAPMPTFAYSPGSVFYGAGSSFTEEPSHKTLSAQ